MRVRFLTDFQSAATGDRFYAAGAVVDLPDGDARAILATDPGAIVVVPLVAREGQAKQEATDDEPDQPDRRTRRRGR